LAPLRQPRGPPLRRSPSAGHPPPPNLQLSSPLRYSPPYPISMSTLGLDFCPGVGVQSAILHRFGSPVNFYPISGARPFVLVISIRRCKLRLSESSVALILQATIGGVTTNFRPKQLSKWVFSFVVASRDVGFHIFKLKSFICDQYKVFFHLWGNGGPHWNSEYRKFL
jgi:hypothetical protein